MGKVMLVTAEAAERAGVIESSSCIEVYRASDKDPVCQKLVLDERLAPKDVPLHFFGGLNERLPAEMPLALDLMEPNADMPLGQKRQAYANIHTCIQRVKC